MNSRLEFALRDAAKVNEAAHAHGAALAKVGVTAAEIAAHGALFDKLSGGVAAHADLGAQVSDEVQRKDGALEDALDLFARLRGCARLAFMRDPSDAAALRAFGVGEPLPRSLAALTRSMSRVEKGLADRAWRASLARRGVGAEFVKSLKAAVAACKDAQRSRVEAGTQKTAVSGDVAALFQRLREQTAYLRDAANVVFYGGPERVAFDPPPRVRKAKAAAGPASPPEAVAKG